MKNLKLRALTEGAIMVALAQVLGYLKFFEFPQGGSITPAMIPIFFYCARWGAGRGLLVSLCFSVLQFALDGAYAYTWQSIILDYLLAFTLLGTAGLFHRRKYGIFYGAVLGSFLRFLSSFFSGVFVWAEFMPEEFLGQAMTNVWIYSAIYNSIYVGANMLIAIAVFAVIFKPMGKYIRGDDLAVS